MIKVDLRYGLEKEDSLFSKIKGVYGENLCKTPHMCKWDFESESCLVELKSRRNKYKAYPTTMIGKNKIDAMLKSDKRSFCVFNFTDGVYSVEITPDIIEKFELRQGGRWDRGRPELNQYYYIPIKLLSPISSDRPSHS
jgi:hypothetical protein